MQPWWKERVVYQIYPRSFCDTNGDGVGDINGIISKLDVLEALGVGVLWLSPVYPSPNEDNGYDISDYCDIHPDFGTLEDFDRLVAEANARDIRIVMDLVINHTSNKHRWFEESRKGTEPYRDYYIWRDGKNGRPPNNWTGFFGGKAWEWDEERGQYYLHLFAPGQPDLNWHEPAVMDEVKRVLRFWLDRGVSGFRCDVINVLYKTSLKNGAWSPALVGREHYLSQPGTHRILKELYRDVFSRYDCFTVGETVLVTPKDAVELTAPENGELTMVFSFEHMDADCYFVKWFLRKFRPKRLYRALVKWQTRVPWNTVYLENHDQPRSVSRFIKPGHEKAGAKALATLLLTLRGTAFVYEGQEIGMTNCPFASMDEVRDVESRNIWALTGRLRLPYRLRWRMIREKSRDNARTPMQWDAGKHAGFSTGTPWLKVNPNHTEINVADQMADENSVWRYYQTLIALRNATPALKEGGFRLLHMDGAVLAYERMTDTTRLGVAVNLSDKPRRLPLMGGVILSTHGKKTLLDCELAPYEACIFGR